METHWMAALSVGFLLGLRHATDADHVAAVTTFVSREKSILRSCWIGASWGVGHSVSLSLAGLAVVGLNLSIPPALESWLESAVAVMLIALGVRAVLYRHSHTHKDTDRPHKHSFLVGMLHGAAGSAALMLIVLSTVASPVQALAYIGVFGFGSIIGMVLISVAMALPIHWLTTRLVSGHRIQAAAGVVTCGVGIYLLL